MVLNLVSTQSHKKIFKYLEIFVDKRLNIIMKGETRD